MGRKKIDKSTIKWLSENLFHGENLEGFQFTAGRTPRAIMNNEPFGLSLSLNFAEGKGRSVIDCSESELEEKIMKEFFPTYEKYYSLDVSKESISNLTEIFDKLGYQTENAEMVGHWYWFRVKCNKDEIKEHVDILKEALKDFKL